MNTEESYIIELKAFVEALKKEVELLWSRMDEQKEFTKLVMTTSGDIRVINNNLETFTMQQNDIKRMLEGISKKQTDYEGERQAIIETLRREMKAQDALLEVRVEALENKPAVDALEEKKVRSRQFVTTLISVLTSAVVGYILARISMLV